jgi:hypothetical protein
MDPASSIRLFESMPEATKRYCSQAWSRSCLHMSYFGQERRVEIPNRLPAFGFGLAEANAESLFDGGEQIEFVTISTNGSTLATEIVSAQPIAAARIATS